MTDIQFSTVKTAAAVVAPYVAVPAHAVTLYAYGFESGLGGWAWQAGDIAPAVSTTYKRTGSYSLRVSGDGSSVDVARLDRTGFVVGHSYTVSGWVTSSSNALGSVSIGIQGKSATSSSGGTGGAFVQVSYTFTATATAHSIELRTSNDHLDAYWDDITLVENVPDEYSTTIEFPILGGRFELNETWSPYARARIEVPAVDPQLLDLLDPREGVRVTLALSRADAFGTVHSARSATLQLRHRVVDHEAGKMTLDLYSDEVLLQRLLNKTKLPDTTATAYQSSTRAIVNWALGKIGKSLEATPNPDSTFYVLENATNLAINASAVTDTAGWNSSGLTSYVRQTGRAGTARGTAHRLNGWAGATDSYIVPATSPIPLTAGKTYTISALFQADAAMTGTEQAGRARRIVVFTKVGAAAYVETVSAQAPNSAGSTRLNVTFTVPVGATEAFVRFYHGHASTSVCYWTDIRISENKATPGINYAEFFDGATTSTTDYGYAWTAAANASTATRTVLASRSPDLLRWSPGQSLSDFLRSLLESAGFRLFADESGKWRMVDSTYSVPGRVTVAEGFNALTGADDIDLDARADDGTPTYFDFVCLEYRWKDSTGTDRTEYDTAGTGDLGYRRVIERPYPGPGAAAYILAKALGRGRTQDVTGLVDYSVTPGQEVAITLPATVPQAGTTTAVDWDLTEDTMRVSSRGLADTPAGSWFFVGDTLTWATVPGTTTWDNYTP